MVNPVAIAIQPSFEDLGTPLVEQTFVVFDLETTGGAAGVSSITEIGAVKVRAGEVISEFQSLVNPMEPIPPMITMLTGISDEMVADAPLVEQALPAFLAWIGDAVLVAHNAAFDVGFVKAVSERIGIEHPQNPVVCTLRLAKRLVRDEVRNLKLSTLAAAFRAKTQPSHRALADARATVDVFHGLLERSGTWGIRHTEELLWFQSVKSHPSYRKVHLFDTLPAERGVYRFVAADGRVLYVGKATNLRARVRSYFGDERKKIGELLQAFDRVEHTVCATDLDCSVLEARMIRTHAPPFNRAQRGLGGKWWLSMTDERFPRLSRVKSPKGRSLGPLSARQAEAVKEAIEEGSGLRSCTDRITTKPSRSGACVRGQIKTCPAPCIDASILEEYAHCVDVAASTLATDPTVLLSALESRMHALSEKNLFEQAATTRDRAGTLVRSVIVARRLRALAEAGTLEVAIGSSRLVIREGFLESVDGVPLPTASDEHHDEPRLIAAWLSHNTHRVRVVRSSGAFSSPIAGGGVLTSWEERLRSLATV